MKSELKYAIIGSGAVATALIKKLDELSRLAAVFVHSDKSYIKLRSEISEKLIFRNYEDIINLAEIFIIAVNDAAISDVAESLSEYDIFGKLFIHTSGVYTKERLEVLQKGKAKIAAAHPFQTFFSSMPDTLTKVPWGIDSNNADYEHIAEFVELTGGIPVSLNGISKEEKALYHLTAVLASNMGAALLDLTKQTADAAGIDAGVFLPRIIETTINNVYRSWERNSELPLTGPVARADVKAVKLHAESMDAAGLSADSYLKLTQIAADAALRHGLIDAEQYAQIYTITNGDN